MTVLLGFAVIVAHLLLAKWLWGFPWADVVMGFPVVAVVAIDMGYFYLRCRKLSAPKRDLEIVDVFDESAFGGGSGTCEARRPCHLRITTGMRDLGILEIPRDAAQFPAQIQRWPRCKPLRIPTRPRMAQNRCIRTQKKHPGQLPNVRF
jgi:hypothetical protein